MELKVGNEYYIFTKKEVPAIKFKLLHIGEKMLTLKTKDREMLLPWDNISFITEVPKLEAEHEH